MNNHEQSFLKTLFRMWGFVKPWKIRFVIGFLVGSISPIYMTLFSSWLLKETIHAVELSSTAMLFNTIKIGVILLIIFIIIFPITYYLTYYVFAMASGLSRKTLFKHIQKLPMSYIEDHYSGDISTRLTTDLNDATQLFGYPLVGQFNPFSLIIAVIISTIVLLYSNFILGIISLSFAGIVFLISSISSKVIRKVEIKVKSGMSKSTQALVDTLGGMKIIRLFGIKTRMLNKYKQEVEEIYNQELKIIKYKAFFSTISNSQVFFSNMIIVFVGVLLCKNGYLTVPVMVFIVNLQAQIGFYIVRAVKNIIASQRYIVSANRIFEILDTEIEVERVDKQTPDFNSKFAVEINNLKFKYANRDENVFDGLNLNIKNLETVAIVGGSGGGKSTIFKILLDYVNENNGTVKIYGHNKKDYSNKTLRSIISYVPQSNYLFDGTIYENILWGNVNATYDQVIKAAKDAYIYDFIMSLPDGFDTRVGEFGAGLSGGQRQRISIARAFLKTAPLLFLDEATSSLDTQSEIEVQKALAHLMEGRTCIVVAHRLSTIKNADKIVVLEKGIIIEEGNHEALINLNGRYHDLYQM